MEIGRQETPNLTVSVSKHEIVCESSMVGGRDKTKMESLNRERERGLRCVYCAHVQAGATAVCIPEPSSPPFCLHLTAVRRLVTTLSPPPPPPQMCTMAVLMETILQLGYIENRIFLNLEKLDLLYFRLLINHEFVYIIVP